MLKEVVSSTRESTKDHPYISGRSLAWFPTLLNYGRCLHLLLLQTFWQLLDPRKEITSLHVWYQWFRNNETLKKHLRKYRYVSKKMILPQASGSSQQGNKAPVRSRTECRSTCVHTSSSSDLSLSDHNGFQVFGSLNANV